jgi:hypothetical protein
MKQIRQNNKKKVNIVVDTSIDTSRRYCIVCHILLVNNPDNTPFDKDICFCPSCGVRYGLKDTEPEERLKTTFPSFMESLNTRYVYQSSKESLPRSEYFVQKRAEEKNRIEVNDPYLKYIRAKNIQIRDIDYYSPE